MSARNIREFAVLGLGRFGSSLVRRLEANGYAVLAIDINPDAVQQIAASATQAVALDTTNEQALRAVDIGSFDTVIVAIGADFEANLLTVAALKNLGVPNVICKAHTDRQRDILLRVGASRVVQPEQSGGIRLAEELSAPTMLERLPLGPSHSIAELIIPHKLAWQSLSQLDLRNRYQVTVLLIKRGDNLIVSPTPDVVLQEDDILVILGENKHVGAFCKLK